MYGLGSFVDINIFVMKYHFILFRIYIFSFSNLLNQIYTKVNPKKETLEFR